MGFSVQKRSGTGFPILDGFHAARKKKKKEAVRSLGRRRGILNYRWTERELKGCRLGLYVGSVAIIVGACLPLYLGCYLFTMIQSQCVHVFESLHCYTDVSALSPFIQL